jgi:hypothetical protein
MKTFCWPGTVQRKNKKAYLLQMLSSLSWQDLWRDQEALHNTGTVHVLAAWSNLQIVFSYTMASAMRQLRI